MDAHDTGSTCLVWYNKFINIVYRNVSCPPTSAKMEILYLSDVYAVAQGTSSHNSHIPLTPITPRSPIIPVVPHATSSTSSSAIPHSPRQATSQKKPKRQISNLSVSSVGPSCFFTLYALKSRPGSVGELFKVSFRCSCAETAQSWVEQITHQMQSKLLLLWGKYMHAVQ